MTVKWGTWNIRTRHMIWCGITLIGCGVLAGLIWKSSIYLWDAEPEKKAQNQTQQNGSKTNPPQTSAQTSQGGDGQPEKKKEKKLRWEGLAICELLAAIAGMALGWFMIELLKADEKATQPSTAATPSAQFATETAPGDGASDEAFQKTSKVQSGSSKEEPSGQRPKVAEGLFSARAHQVEKKINAIKQQALQAQLRAQQSAVHSIVNAGLEEAAKQADTARKTAETAQKAAEAAEAEARTIKLDANLKKLELVKPDWAWQDFQSRMQKRGYSVQALGGPEVASAIENRFVQVGTPDQSQSSSQAAGQIASAFKNYAEEEARIAEIIMQAGANITKTVAKAAYGPVAKGGENAS